MTYFDNYKARLNADGGSESEARLKATQDFTDREFTNSPSYKVVKINGVDTDVRLLTGNTYFDREMLLRPKTSVNIGDYVVDGSDTYLVFDFLAGKIAPKAILKQCTEVVKWATFSYPAVVNVTNKFTMSDDNRFDLDMVYGYVDVYIPADTNTLSIPLSTRIVLGTQVYEVVAKDDIGIKGLLRLSGKIVPANSSDDITNKDGGNVLPPPPNGSDHLW